MALQCRDVGVLSPSAPVCSPRFLRPLGHQAPERELFELLLHCLGQTLAQVQPTGEATGGICLGRFSLTSAHRAMVMVHQCQVVTCFEIAEQASRIQVSEHTGSNDEGPISRASWLYQALMIVLLPGCLPGPWAHLRCQCPGPSFPWISVSKISHDVILILNQRVETQRPWFMLKMQDDGEQELGVSEALASPRPTFPSKTKLETRKGVQGERKCGKSAHTVLVTVDRSVLKTSFLE